METKPSSVKTIIIISGVMGVLLGIAMTYFLFPRVVKEDNIITNETTLTDTVFIEKEKLVYRSKKEPCKAVAVVDTLQLDSTQIGNADSLANTDDTDLVYAKEDTAIDNLDTNHAVTNVDYASLDGGKIRVAENELVYVAHIKPSGDASYFYCRDDNDNLDSLLMDNYVPKHETDKMRVEFWASLIHAVGYRLSKNRLVLFGFYEYKNVSLKYLEDGSVQMNYFDNVYVLRCGDEFRTLNIKKR